ncbi:ribonuclease E/G [Georgenia thermotolerans]|uniref:ribonuclease E/G n=1 Tax=Georgenia thermotolerans TaxID=527326 RepID=UPI001D00E498|nr:ribonuclease E/G [Georgenia thermotolerans]
MNDETIDSGAETAAEEQKPARRTRSRRATSPATAPQASEGTAATSGGSAGQDAPAEAAPKAETKAKAGTTAKAEAAPEVAEPTKADAAEPAPKKRATRTRKAPAKKAPAAETEQAPATGAGEAAAGQEAPAPDAAAPEVAAQDAGAQAPDQEAAAETPAQEAPAKRKAPARRTGTRRATSKKTAPAAETAAAEDGGAPAETAAAEDGGAPAEIAASTEAAGAPAETVAFAEAGADTAPAGAASETPAAGAAGSEAAAEEKPAPKKTRARRATKKSIEEQVAGPVGGTGKEIPGPALAGDTGALEAEDTTTTAAEESAPVAPARELQGPALGEDTTGLTVEDTTPGAGEVEQAPKRPARRSRRATAPARSPEQKLDVLAELGVRPAAEAAEPEGEAEEEPTDEELAEAAFEDVAVAGAEQPQAPEEESGPRLPATALLFQAPDATKARKRRRAQAPAGAPAPADEAAEPTEPEELEEQPGETGEAEEEHGGGRRRRRRGGRGRRNRNQHEAGEEAAEEESAATPVEAEEESAEEADATEAETEAETEGEEGTSSSRRRRRRRTRTRTAEAEAGGRSARDEVTALKGSTRLEAKRQRRREGREAGRRRPTITESEFLARREAVKRSMVVREKDGLNQIGVLEDGILVEHYVARHTQTSMVGNVYLGRVQNVLPSMEAAFVDLGKGRNAVLYAGEVNWDAAGMEGQPRRIEQALKSGDSVLVQVTKDPIGHKGARLTSQITLAGRHLVLVPSGAMTGISRKLPENERARLKKLLKQIVPDGAGVIVRTAAEGATEEQLRADVERLTKQWADIEAKAKSAKSAPVLLKGEPELAVRVVRDVFNEDFENLVVSGDTAWQTISQYVRELSPDLADRLHHWTDRKDVFSEYRVDEQLAKAMDRKVWLPSGGSLIIDRTEAMTVIDVNTGKFTGSGGTLEETVTRNNLEAAEEVVRQLRLRDIGGIIVIDFIDMVLESNRDLVMRRLLECLGRDRTRHQVAEVTSLGLVQMTRKRVGQGLVEAFSTPCECCNGRGFIVHEEPVEKSGSGDGHAHGEESGSGSRRRGRRGGQPAPEPVAEPEAPAVEDEAAVAAREAVKATLATIAAAAANAHQESHGAKKAPADTSSAPAGVPAPTGGSDEPATAPEEAAEAAPGAESAAVASASSAPAAPVKTGVIGAQAAVPPAGEETTSQVAQADVTGEDLADEGQGDVVVEPPALAAPVPSTVETIAEPAPKRRRSRRAVSSGVVTPGETKIITLDLPEKK